jgi:hypothetical protein
MIRVAVRVTQNSRTQFSLRNQYLVLILRFRPYLSQTPSISQRGTDPGFLGKDGGNSGRALAIWTCLPSVLWRNSIPAASTIDRNEDRASGLFSPL